MQTLQLDSNCLIGTSGSGNQTKIWVDNKHLIKVNSKFREASKEVDAYKLAIAFGLNCAKYNEIDVVIHGTKRKACITESFIYENESEVTVAEILDALNINIPMNMSAIDYINTTAAAIHYFTKIHMDAVYDWLYDMLVFDYIICNNDRHLTNFSVIYNENMDTFRLSPYYDHGQSFFCTDASLSLSNHEKIERRFKTKPFSSDPDRNIGEYKRAIKSLRKMLTNVGVVAGINDLELCIGHKVTVLRRIKRLESLLNKR